MSPKPMLRPALEAVPDPAETGFLTSEELGEQLQHLADAQANIDRQKAEELARLREIQDRD
jgi:hypothetical protein